MTRTASLRTLTVGLVVLLVALPAMAQKFVGNPLSRLDTSPPLTRSELRIIDSIIGLAPDQRELTNVLYDEFFDRFQTEAAAVESEVIALIARRTILDSDDAAEYPTLLKDEPLRAAEIFEDVRAERVRVRDVNISALVPIVQRLSADDAARLTRAFFRQATDHLVPPSMTEARVRSASSLPTLSDEQRARVLDAISQLEQRKERWTRTFFDAVADSEESSLPPELAWAVAKATFVAEEDNLSNIMAERLEIDRDAWRQISAVLAPQQRADLPRPVQETVRFGSIRPRGL